MKQRQSTILYAKGPDSNLGPVISDDEMFLVTFLFLPHTWFACRARSEPGGMRWRTGGEVKGKLANGVGSKYSHATSERGISSITKADAYNSAASIQLNWCPHRFKWTRPFRGKMKSGFCARTITFRTSYTFNMSRQLPSTFFSFQNSI